MKPLHIDPTNTSEISTINERIVHDISHKINVAQVPDMPYINRIWVPAHERCGAANQGTTRQAGE